MFLFDFTFKKKKRAADWLLKFVQYFILPFLVTLAYCSRVYVY